MDKTLYTNEEYRALLGQLDELTQKAERLPYPEARDLVFELLQNFDRMHREALIRMVDMIEQKDLALITALKSDFVIRTLLQLYDLADEDTPLPDTRKYTQLGFVPEHEVKILTPIKKTGWLLGGKLEDMVQGRLYTKEFEGKHLLLCRINEEVIALKNACVGSMLPLDKGQLESHFLICPWHGCQYNLLSGELLDAPGVKLEKYPVYIEKDGQYKVEVLLN